MEKVLDVYHEPYNPLRPVVCFDEATKQLIRAVRFPLPMKPGQPLRYDYEYERIGTANLFTAIPGVGTVEPEWVQEKGKNAGTNVLDLKTNANMLTNL